jgi:hypothetical protein
MSDVSPFEQDLLRSARELDVPPRGGMERARALLSVGIGGAAASQAKPAATARKAAWPAWKIGLVSVLGLGAVGGGALALSVRTPLASSPVVSVQNAPPVVSPMQTESPAAEPTPVEPAAAAADPPPCAAVSSHKAPSPSSASSLTAQTDLLDKAHAALDARHPAAALGLLADYDKTYPGGILSQEASALRIEALYDAGRSPEAAALADRFLAAYPSSSHAEHVRAGLLGGLSPGFLVAGCIETAELGTIPDASDDRLKIELDAPTGSREASEDAPAQPKVTNCMVNDDCLIAGEYCEKPVGDCTSPGVCTSKPISCPKGGATVCDCNNHDQTNACEAAVMGLALLSEAPCAPAPKIEAGTADAPLPPDAK